MKLLGARNSKTIVGLVCLMTGFFNLRLDGQVRPPVRMDDNSDWWSYLRPGDEDEVAGVLKRPIADATFKLLNHRFDRRQQRCCRSSPQKVGRRHSSATW
jgi:hypothetical protein